MPRVHKRQPGSRRYASFSPDILRKAIDEVEKKKMSIRKAAEIYGLCPSTISRNLKKGNYQERKYGKPTVLSAEEEQVLKEGLLLAALWGFPFDRLQLRLVVKAFLDRRGKIVPQFKNNLPGEEWCTSFLSRHEELKTRFCENIKRNRAAVSQETIRNYFDHLSTSLEGVSPDLIVNYDETNLTDDPGKSKVIIRRGAKHAERIMDSSKVSTSVMFSGTASGDVLPPFVVYKSKYIYDVWTERGPKGTVYGNSNSGWFDSHLFEQWFFRVVLKYFKNKDPLNEKPKLLIGDNLASHISITVIESCRKHNIRFVLLPKNSTHLCQPLDVAFFRPLKAKWRQVLKEFKEKYKGTINKTVFLGLLKKALDSMQNASKSMQAGFRATGIHPLDSTQVLKRLPKETDGYDSNDSWAESFIEVLKEARFGQAAETKQRKRRLQVEPGQAITSEDLQEVTTPEQPAKRAKKPDQPSKRLKKPDTLGQQTKEPVQPSKKSDKLVKRTKTR